MSWTQHITGEAALPQSCSRCNKTLIPAGAPSDPLPAGGPAYVNDRVGEDGIEPDNTIALEIPFGYRATACKAG